MNDIDLISRLFRRLRNAIIAICISSEETNIRRRAKLKIVIQGQTWNETGMK
jgi:hypothetical protein